MTDYKLTYSFEVNVEGPDWPIDLPVPDEGKDWPDEVLSVILKKGANYLFEESTFIQPDVAVVDETYSCDNCDGHFLEDDMHTLGGDHDSDSGPVAFPAVCNDCARAEENYWAARCTIPTPRITPQHGGTA